MKNVPLLALAVGLALLPVPAMTQDWLRAFPEGVVAFGMAVVSFSARDIVDVEALEIDDLSTVRLKFAQELGRAFTDASRDKPLENTAIYFCGRPVPGQPVLVQLDGPEMVLVTESAANAEVLVAFLKTLSCAKLTS